MPKFKIKQDYVVIPTKVIDEIFPTTNAVFIKVYLHLMMLSATCSEIDFSIIADRLQLLESDVAQSVRYWQNLGLIQIENDDDTEARNVEADEKKTVFQTEPEKNVQIESDELIFSKIESNSSLSEMMQLAQNVLGRIMSPAEMKSLYWLYEELKFSPEVILMLLEYCASSGKKSMSYIERVAGNWHKNGINTIEAVEDFLSDNDQKKKFMKNLKSVFSLYDRDFVPAEEEYLEKWHDDFGMSEEMIALAYEYCIIKINKLSFPYMDKIISNWKEKNIFTIDAAEKDNQSHKTEISSNFGDFDIMKKDTAADDLERITWDKI